ncbi:MAG: HAMP domain-containing histidine kinase [Promicromonosporaceae bacterium]|nr:HAMP domain-containing histidine kinase [Promicromonosporaceae bacterium]
MSEADLFVLDPLSHPARSEQPPNRWSRLPLRIRLVAIIVVVLIVGLGVTALMTHAVVSRYFMGQVDAQLARTIGDTSALQEVIGPATSPSDYHVTIRLIDSAETIVSSWPTTVELHGEPQLPSLTSTFAAAKRGEPFTVPSIGGTSPTRWRVVVAEVTFRSPGHHFGDGARQEGLVAVALPLTDARQAGRMLARTMLVIGLGTITAGGIAARMLVRRSLRPLTQIETTAAEIAAGDLTQRIAAAPAGTEVGSLTASLNAMLAQIERAFAARSASEARTRSFAADASHELRTPLAAIRGYAELYRLGGVPNEAVSETFARIEDSATRLGGLVEDLLTLTRLDEGARAAFAPVNLTALAADAAADLRALDPTREVEVISTLQQVQDGAGLIAVNGDADRLRQVLTNLIGNVARHTPSGSPVEIAVGLIDAVAPFDAWLEVRDHGPGVTGEQLELIFDRFYRADPSRTRASGGAGLGLAIVAAIVQAHDGTICALPTPGGGLTIRITLPLAPRQ